MLQITHTGLHAYKDTNDLLLLLLSSLLLLFIISSMQGIYTYIPQTNHVSRQ
jgi:uncharacterized membrane-anchored protein